MSSIIRYTYDLHYINIWRYNNEKGNLLLLISSFLAHIELLFFSELKFDLIKVLNNLISVTPTNLMYVLVHLGLNIHFYIS